MRSPQQQPRRHRQARRAPTSCTPIPAIARPIVEAVHRRYLAACERGERPAIDDPFVAAALLTAQECTALAKCGYHPIPEAVIRLGCTPSEQKRRAFLDIVAHQLPEAVKFISESIT